MTDTTYNVMNPDKGVPAKAWTKGVPVESIDAVMEAQKDLVDVVHTLRQVVWGRDEGRARADSPFSFSKRLLNLFHKRFLAEHFYSRRG